MDRDLASQSSPLKSLAREYSFGTVSGCTWECVDQVWKVCAQEFPVSLGIESTPASGIGVKSVRLESVSEAEICEAVVSGIEIRYSEHRVPRVS